MFYGRFGQIQHRPLDRQVHDFFDILLKRAALVLYRRLHLSTHGPNLWFLLYSQRKGSKVFDRSAHFRFPENQPPWLPAYHLLHQLLVVVLNQLRLGFRH